MGRYLSLLLLVLGLLAVVVATGEPKDAVSKGGVDGADDSSKGGRKFDGNIWTTGALASDPEAAAVAAQQPSETKENTDYYEGVFVKPDKDGSCPDASQNNYTSAKVSCPVQQAAEMATVLEGHRKGRTLELASVVDPTLRRVGCGMYYFMTLQVKSFYDNGLEQSYECEYFVSDYDRHYNLWYKVTNKGAGQMEAMNGMGRLPPRKIVSEHGPCQDPSVHEYTDTKITRQLIKYANEIIRAENLQNKQMFGFLKLDKVKQRPGCGMYYKNKLVVTDVSAGNKKENYDYELYQNRDGSVDVYFQAALPPK